MNNPYEKSTSNDKKMNILIIDDDRKGTPYLIEELRDTYLYNVTWLFKKDDKVEEIINTHPFDAIILDIMMPPPDSWSDEEKRQSENGMSTGNVLFRKIREKYQEKPIIILTGKTTIGIDAGPYTRILRKPEFVSKVNETLKTLLYDEK
ncbi:MAG: hypothetical protein NT004_09775 [Bacteroidetes bacterium]|nr:hypothetical protein [Bacteroidota bacterium]